MTVEEWLDKVAYIGKSKIKNDSGAIYYSKFDGSYITRVGMEDSVYTLALLEITENLTHGVGFSPKDNKWYGWSHRAIYGFTVGSTCKIGDCHYVPDTLEHAVESAVMFWSDKYNEAVSATKLDDEKMLVTWRYLENVPNEKLRGTISGVEHYYKLGRGEWVAETMEDAKQMAVDFCDGVS